MHGKLWDKHEELLLMAGFIEAAHLLVMKLNAEEA